MSKDNYFNFLSGLLNQDNTVSDIKKVTEIIFECILKNNSIWILGNGGSASTAEHFETDLSFVRYYSNSLKIKASALTSNSSLITAIANDLGFENIFSHQLLRKAIKGDLCVVISASGNSLNLIRAIDVAKQIGLKSIGLLGFDGGKLASQVNFPVIVETEIGKYGPVEDVHLAICHAISKGLLDRIITTGLN